MLDPKASPFKIADQFFASAQRICPFALGIEPGRARHFRGRKIESRGIILDCRYSVFDEFFNLVRRKADAFGLRPGTKAVNEYERAAGT